MKCLQCIAYYRNSRSFTNNMTRYFLNITYIYMIYKNNRIEITLYMTGNHSALSVKGRLSVVL